MDIEPNLGASREQLQQLHEFAQSYLKEKADREKRESDKLEKMRQELNGVGKPFRDLWASMESHKMLSVPHGENSFLVVEKSFDRLQMAITADGINGFGVYKGHTPTFDHISEWQDITFDGTGKDKTVRSIYHWDKGQLDKVTKEWGPYWGSATEIRVGNFDKVSPDDLVRSYQEASVIIKVPQELLFTKE